MKAKNMEIKQNNICPECDSVITLFKEPKKGDVLECHVCGAESEVIQSNPLELSPLEEEK